LGANDTSARPHKRRYIIHKTTSVRVLTTIHCEIAYQTNDIREPKNMKKEREEETEKRKEKKKIGEKENGREVERNKILQLQFTSDDLCLNGITLSYTTRLEDRD